MTYYSLMTVIQKIYLLTQLNILNTERYNCGEIKVKPVIFRKNNLHMP